MKPIKTRPFVSITGQNWESCTTPEIQEFSESNYRERLKYLNKK